MTVNGMRPDADGNVLVVVLGMADVAAEVAKETERAKAEEAKNASAAKTAAAKADEAQTSLDDHVANANNPHSVTAAQVGALPVNNTDKELKFGILTGNGISLAGTFYDDNDPRMVKLRFAEASFFGSGMNVKGRISLTKNPEFPEYGNGELLVDGVNVMDAIDSKAGKTELASKADIVDGKVPAAQLPSFVDDVLEYDALSAFPATGETGKIYVAKDTNKTYRWGGTQYVEISQSLALGETSATAYPGDKGKDVADSLKKHVENTSNPHAVTAEQVGAVALVEDANGAKTAATIGIRKSSAPIGAFSLANGTFVTASGHSSHAEGDNTTASGMSSHAEGTYTTALGEYSHSEGNSTTAAGVCSHAEGEETRADGHASHAEGYRSHTRVEDAYACAWNGDDARADQYVSHGKGTFNVNPVGGAEGFYVGEKKLSEVILGSVTNNISAENLAFSNAVLAVGLNIDTNSVAVLNEIADTFGGFPIEGTATTVGGLLAALAAAVAWLRKKKIDKLTVTGMFKEVTANGGVAKLDDFFTESNSLLTSRVNTLIDSKVGDVNAVLTAALDGTEVA